MALFVAKTNQMVDLKNTEQLQRAVHIKIGETLCFLDFLEHCNKKEKPV